MREILIEEKYLKTDSSNKITSVKGQVKKKLIFQYTINSETCELKEKVKSLIKENEKLKTLSNTYKFDMNQAKRQHAESVRELERVSLEKEEISRKNDEAMTDLNSAIEEKMKEIEMSLYSLKEDKEKYEILKTEHQKLLKNYNEEIFKSSAIESQLRNLEKMTLKDKYTSLTLSITRQISEEQEKKMRQKIGEYKERIKKYELELIDYEDIKEENEMLRKEIRRVTDYMELKEEKLVEFRKTVNYQAEQLNRRNQSEQVKPSANVVRDLELKIIDLKNENTLLNTRLNSLPGNSDMTNLIETLKLEIQKLTMEINMLEEASPKILSPVNLRSPDKNDLKLDSPMIISPTVGSRYRRMRDIDVAMIDMISLKDSDACENRMVEKDGEHESRKLLNKNQEITRELEEILKESSKIKSELEEMKNLNEKLKIEIRGIKTEKEKMLHEIEGVRKDSNSKISKEKLNRIFTEVKLKLRAKPYNYKRIESIIRQEELELNGLIELLNAVNLKSKNEISNDLSNVFNSLLIFPTPEESKKNITNTEKKYNLKINEFISDYNNMIKKIYEVKLEEKEKRNMEEIVALKQHSIITSNEMKVVKESRLLLKEEISKLNEDLHRANEDSMKNSNYWMDLFYSEREIRRKYQDEILEIKGNIRVFCRVRPLLTDDEKKGINLKIEDKAIAFCVVSVKIMIERWIYI